MCAIPRTIPREGESIPHSPACSSVSPALVWERSPPLLLMAPTDAENRQSGHTLPEAGPREAVSRAFLH